MVEKVGPGVTRFKPGDHVVTNGAGPFRDDYRFGAYQRLALTTQELTTKVSPQCCVPESSSHCQFGQFTQYFCRQIGDNSFEDTAVLSTSYSPASALFLHLGLERPSFAGPNLQNKQHKILIWGASSSFGAFAVQLAVDSGYTVVGVASGRNASLVTSIGATHFIDRTSPTAVIDLIALGPFKAVLAAADSAEDQVRIAAVMAGQGGGDFLSTMGLRQGVALPDNVTVSFHQYLDDYLDPANKDFTEWFWWEYLENALERKKLKGLPIVVKGGLSQVKVAWDALREERLSGQRQVIRPDLD